MSPEARRDGRVHLNSLANESLLTSRDPRDRADVSVALRWAAIVTTRAVETAETEADSLESYLECHGPQQQPEHGRECRSRGESATLFYVSECTCSLSRRAE